MKNNYIMSNPIRSVGVSSTNSKSLLQHIDKGNHDFIIDLLINGWQIKTMISKFEIDLVIIRFILKNNKSRAIILMMSNPNKRDIKISSQAFVRS